MSDNVIDEYNIDDEEYDKDTIKRKKRRDKMIFQLQELNEDDSLYNSSDSTDFISPSKLLTDKKEKKKSKKERKIDEMNEWNTMMRSMKFKKSGKYYKDLDSYDDIFENKKKKKKKKKKKNELTDFYKEFEPEIALYRNLLRDQSKFTDSLQKEYDAMKSTKSSVRGINKNMTDLMENITDARTLAMQLIEKNVNTKKLIAELTMKEKKELGGIDTDSNINDFASSLLNKMISERSQLIGGPSAYENEIVDFDDEDSEVLTNALYESIGDDKRSPEAQQNLEEEKVGAKDYIVMSKTDMNDKNYYRVTIDAAGNILKQSTVPDGLIATINRNQERCTDKDGQHFDIKWKEDFE